MAAESERDSEASRRDRLPFEPVKKRQKPAKTTSNPVAEPISKSEQVRKSTKEEMAIPKVVSTRMARRMAVLCGTPTFLGVATFFVSYIVVSHGWLKLPNVAVLLTSMGFFGLGVLGLSYGVLSASWDEERVGGLLGWQEFKVNCGRMIETWRETRQKNV